MDVEPYLDDLASVEYLHTFCHAFVARWEYFDDYLRHSYPIVMGLLERFGNHPTDLELSYVCERLLILHNYVRLGLPELGIK